MYHYYRYLQYSKYVDYLSKKCIGTALTGKAFNQQFINNVFVKLTNPSENHNGYQFKTGLNVDFREFNPTDNCEPGGFYFTEFDKMEKWIDNNESDSDIYEPMVFCRKVIIPDEAEVYIEDNKFKTDQFILGSRGYIKDLNLKNEFLSLQENQDNQVNDIFITIINYNDNKNQTGC